MKARKFGFATALVAVAFLASGCQVTDMMGKWFSSPHKSKIKGQRVSVMASDESVKPDASLQAEPVTLPPPYRNADWPEPGGYASNAMYHLEASGPLKQVWDETAGDGSGSDSRLTASPVVVGGRIFVLDATTHVYAFNAATGEEEWHESIAPKGRRSFMNAVSFGLFGTNTNLDTTKGAGGGLAFDDGKLFATTGFGEVMALNPANGKEIWRVQLTVPVLNAPVANGGRVFVSSQDNHFYAFAEANGRQLWDHSGIAESSGIMESTSAAVAGEFVLAPYTSGEIYALRVQNGRAAWSDMLTRSHGVTALSEIDDIAGRPVVDRDLVFAISHSGVMAAIQIDSGDRQWSRDLGGIQTPWVAGDYVYVVTLESQLICLTRKEGKVRWIHQLPRWVDPEDTSSDPIVWSGPVLVSDRLVVVSSSGFAQSLSPYTGELLSRMEIPDKAYIAPVVANDTLYILTNDADLVALR